MNGLHRLTFRRAAWMLVAFSVSGVFFPLPANKANAADFLVRDQEAYAKAVKQLAPGDTIRLANGEWRDFEIVFQGEGLAEAPITLTAETKGKVFITGRSNLRLGGTHLVVSGLVFKDGHTPTNDVIAFRRSKQHLANHSRVTEVVIDGFNNPERHETDFWVMMYGRHNRFDHSYLLGKRNAGVTMAVRLDSPASQKNHHRIDHNYFGPRPILGSNGGETLRIGTSKYSLADSSTLVERNFFERCNGEVEIVSNKAGGNVFRGNVFLESRGTLTLRHGNGNLIEGNAFLGKGAPHTGGIRIINARQTIRNNYLEGLTGHRFGGALVVMNGVPDSPINRYHRVEDVVIENNTIIDSDHLELAAGSDAERSAVPRRTVFRRNLIVNSSPKDSIAVHDDISGIAFDGNVLDGVETMPVASGFEQRRVELVEGGNGLKYPAAQGLEGIGAPPELELVARDETGPDWYEKPAGDTVFQTGRRISVEPGEDTLSAGVNQTGAGDVLVLVDGHYLVGRILTLAHPVSVVAAKDTRPRIVFERSTLFELADGGSLELVGLDIDGELAPDAYGNSVVRTSRYSMLQNYVVRVKNTKVTSLDSNHSFNFLRVAAHTFARRIEVLDSEFRSVTGDLIALDRESDDLGIYNGELIVVTDSEFRDVSGAVLSIYRGGSDESTFGPKVIFQRNRLHQVGAGKRNKRQASLYLHGAQLVEIRDNSFEASEPIRIQETVGEPRTTIAGNAFVETAVPLVQEFSP